MGRATVIVSIQERPHDLMLTFHSREFTTLDKLVENIRQEVEEFGMALAEAAKGQLL
jgi:hypothetical protein